VLEHRPQLAVQCLDPGYDDLLASEARLTSFIAIAKGEVPASHWFKLGRALTPVGWGSALVSWSGSMFEYLMPALVMRSPAGSLLDQTCHVRRNDGLVLLFTPPFDRADPDPGYIKGYLPGVRENGGQYTHAAIWSVLAFAALGEGDKAGELFALLNPIKHASTRVGVHRYKVEPYVVAADIYADPPHVGRGGWTWYTGSAGWMYRAGLEWILGFRLRGTMLHLDPCIPRAWQSFAITFRYHSSRYDIVVENPRGVARGVASVALDGAPLAGSGVPIPLADDSATHQVRVVLGSKTPRAPSCDTL